MVNVACDPQHRQRHRQVSVLSYFKLQTGQTFYCQFNFWERLPALYSLFVKPDRISLLHWIVKNPGIISHFKPLNLRVYIRLGQGEVFLPQNI